MFSPTELSWLLKSLSFLNSSGVSVVRRDLQDSLVASCEQKLTSYSVLTSFTQQEYTVLYAAVSLGVDSQEADGSKVIHAVYDLRDRLYDLAHGSFLQE